jgi:hypothetical protein
MMPGKGHPQAAQLSVKEQVMAAVLCEIHPGSSEIVVSVGVKDVYNVETYLWAPPDFVTRRNGQTYLPIGVVYTDRDKGVALIEFPHQADSGASRIWVPLSSLLEPSEAQA